VLFVGHRQKIYKLLSCITVLSLDAEILAF